MDTLVKKGIIEKIENLADEKEKEIQENYYNKYHHFYTLALSVLKRHKVLLYGGTAINELFPPKYKFYEKKQLPDIDIFCTDYAPIADDIIRTFAKKGYTLTTVTEALHPNTYKIMIEGLQLIDLSVVDETFFKLLSKNNHKTSLGLYTVNVDYIKYSFHIVLSEPMYAFRWAKVYQRMVRFYEIFPINTKCTLDVNKYYINLPEEINTKINNVIKKLNLLSFGWDVIQTYLEEDTTINASSKKPFLFDNSATSGAVAPVRYTITNKNIDGLLEKVIKNTGLQLDHMFPGDEVLPKYICLSYNKERCLYIFETPNCISYLTYKQKKVMSIHSLLHYLYAMYLSTQDKDIYCIIQILTVLQINNAFSKKKLFQQFILNCYGSQKGIVTLRKERFLRIKNM